MKQQGSPLGDLITRALADGRVDLVALTDDQEEVVGQGEWVMTRADVHAAWVSLDQKNRASRTREALDAMTASEAMRTWSVAEGRIVLDLSPELYLVDAARRNPSFLTYGLDDADRIDGAIPSPRGYGLMDSSGLHGVVVELVGPTVHFYRLMSVPAFLTATATWLWEAVTSEALGIRIPAASVCVVHPPQQTPARTNSVDVRRDPAGRVLVRLEEAESQVTNPVDLVDALAASHDVVR